MSQKGFATVIFILTILLLTGVIVGGAFYLKKTNPQISENINNLFLKQKVPTDSNVGSQENTSIVQIKNTSLDYKVVYYAAKEDINKGPFTLNTADISLKNSQLLNSELAPESQTKQDFVSAVVNNFNLLSTPAICNSCPGTSKYYYIVSNDGKLISQLDLEKIKANLGSEYSIYIAGWSADGQKIVFTGLKNDGLPPDQNVKHESFIAEYDIKSQNFKKIYSINTEATFITQFLYYDPVNNLLAYSTTNDNIWTGDNAHLINLSTNSEITFPFPKMHNNYGNNEERSQFTQYFVSSDASSASARNKLNIYAITDPNKVLAQINLDDLSRGSRFASTVLWSPKYNYFITQVLTNMEIIDEIDKKAPDFWSKIANITYDNLYRIYNRKGQLISGIQIDPISKTHEVYMFTGSVFSDDEKYLLLRSATIKNDLLLNNSSTWQLIEVATGKKIGDPKTVTGQGYVYRLYN